MGESPPKDPAGSSADAASEADGGSSADAASEAGDAPETDPATGGVPEADLLPWRGTTDGDVRIKTYVVTGRHGGITIPESFCRECHLFVRAADVAAEQVDADVEVSVASWWTHFLGALRYGGYHPPVMVVGGKRLCQGHDVPTVEEVVAAIEETLDR